MTSYLFQKLSNRLNQEMDKERMEVGGGSCWIGSEGAEHIAMRYRERVGYLSGMKRSLEIAEALEDGKED
jgi:hypothetical protein